MIFFPHERMYFSVFFTRFFCPCGPHEKLSTSSLSHFFFDFIFTRLRGCWLEEWRSETDEFHDCQFCWHNRSASTFSHTKKKQYGNLIWQVFHSSIPLKFHFMTSHQHMWGGVCMCAIEQLVQSSKIEPKLFSSAGLFPTSSCSPLMRVWHFVIIITTHWTPHISFTTESDVCGLEYVWSASHYSHITEWFWYVLRAP